MKKMLLVLLLLPVLLMAQKELPKDESGKINFTEVVEAKGLSKGELFANAEAWFGSYYRSPKVIQSKDDMDGIIVGKSMFKVYIDIETKDRAGVVKYTIELAIKEGRYKYSIANLKHKDHTDKVGTGGDLENNDPFCGYDKLNAETWKFIKEQAYDNVGVIVENLKKGMAPASEKNGDKW